MAAFPIGFGLSPDGDLLVQWRRIAVERSTRGSVADARDVIVRHGYDGAALDTVLSLPLEKAIRKDKGATTDARLFEREARWTVLGGGVLAVGVNDSSRLELRDQTGRVREEIDLPRKRIAITDADRRSIQRIVRRQTEAKGGPGSAADDYLEGVDFGDHLPAFTRLMAGPDGTLWVGRPRAPRDMEIDGVRLALSIADLVDDSRLWDVFGDDGDSLGLVEVPDRFTPMSFAGDTVYGAFRDEFDVEYVRAYVFVGELRWTK